MQKLIMLLGFTIMSISITTFAKDPEFIYIENIINHSSRPLTIDVVHGQPEVSRVLNPNDSSGPITFHPDGDVMLGLTDRKPCGEIEIDNETQPYVFTRSLSYTTYQKYCGLRAERTLVSDDNVHFVVTINDHN